MSPFLLLAKTNSKNHKPRQVTQSFIPRIKVGTASLGLLFVLVFFFIGFFYIVQINDLATKGYEIQALEDRYQQLKDWNEKLEAQAAELSSLQNLQKTLGGLPLIETLNIEYIKDSS